MNKEYFGLDSNGSALYISPYHIAYIKSIDKNKSEIHFSNGEIIDCQVDAYKIMRFSQGKYKHLKDVKGKQNENK